MALPADAKVILARILRVTAEAGGRAIAIGRRIVALALAMAKSFPNTTFGAIVGLILTAVIGGVPLIGGTLAALVGPFLLACGITVGALADMRDGGMRDAVERFVDELQSLVV